MRERTERGVFTFGADPAADVRVRRRRGRRPRAGPPSCSRTTEPRRTCRWGWSAAPRRQRHGGRGRRDLARGPARPGRRARWPRQPRPRGGAWRCTSARTASRSSTTRTTPTPTPCGRRWRRSPPSGAVGPGLAPSRFSERCASWARRRPRSTRPLADWRCAWTSTSCSWWGRRRGRSTWERRGAQEPAGSESVLVADAEAASDWLRRELHPGDVVLFKASNAVQLSRVAQALLEDPRVEEGSR